MSDFEKNDRVVVTRGEHSNKHGKVIGERTSSLLEHKYPIKLDDDSVFELKMGFLEPEALKSHEIAAEVKNVKSQVNRVANQLPGEMATELPTHLRLLEEAIASKDKGVSDYEYNYITNNFTQASKTGSVTPEWRESIRISLEKIHWAVKCLS
jgi:hypothetical protein